MPATLTRRAATALTAAVTAALALAGGTATPAAAADPVTVSLTLTGPSGLIFDGEVTTTGHTVTPVSGGAHLCDGTNNGANPTAGATPTAALDDAADDNGFDWAGVWYSSFEDYLVTTIDGYSQDADHFYEISVNGTPTPVGGCQFLLAEGDEVAFTWTEIW
ncbi:DUF4430 domain-containing protein [Streptomyces litchfieldiae]|uniref:DUF4430 domain-containing protein n=1 Tax=Streptomyces litchfieldiae TaxID=3075543 RepID=A0ABU2MK98_9ACTN|nr:DUF4430 domain-containing protein [Streptomyces sp. DSM 44938]MDT0341109.1 DUF4430 domain-containing protein [Streptomyces sp. DSM 44938]